MAQTPLVAGVKNKLLTGLANLTSHTRAGNTTENGAPTKFQRLRDIPSDQPFLSRRHSAAAIGGLPTLYAGSTTINKADPS